MNDDNEPLDAADAAFLAEGERLARLCSQLQADQERRRRALLKDARGKLRPVIPSNGGIRDAAVFVEPIRSDRYAEIWICPNPARAELLRLREMPKLKHLMYGDPDALNGYVAFPKRHAPKVPPGFQNIVQYIPVHGGVTWACKDRVAAVWGFDTMHYNSAKEPRAEPDWIRAHCMILYRGLLLAERLWPEFRHATLPRRGELAQQLVDLIPEQPMLDKLGITAILNLMCGKVG